MSEEQRDSMSGQPPSDLKPSPSESPQPSFWKQIVDVLFATGIFSPEEWQIRRLLRIAITIAVLVFVFAVARHGMAHVRENQVGVMVNNLTGNTILKDRVGYHLFLPYLVNYYVLDKTIQKLELTWAIGPGGTPRDIKLKTSDGSDVSLDVTISFKLIPEKAVEVLQRSGEGMRFADLWIESFARHVCLSTFGELTTENMYDAVKRNEKAETALRRMNVALQHQGIEVIAVVPGEFRFYREYEQVIQEKKLADQQVEEQQAQARAAMEDQERQLIEARKRAEVQLTALEGESRNRLIQARAESEKIRREADGYYAGTLLAADASLYSASAEAIGKQATLLAEAEGMEQMRQAMSGDGGIGMIGLEYARRLRNVRFTGTAITRDPHVQQFSVQSPQDPVVSPVIPPAAAHFQPASR